MYGELDVFEMEDDQFIDDFEIPDSEAFDYLQEMFLGNNEIPFGE